MKTWTQALQDGLWPGMSAGLLSLGVLAWRGRKETGSVFAPVNAPSHWLWSDRALRRDGPSWRYTGVGVLVHQGASLFWGVLYERFFANRQARHPLHADLRDAVVATAAAATVDFVMTPRRFTPGFEKRLSARSLLWVYAGFALGVALGSRAVRRHGGDGERIRTDQRRSSG
jgi:hypothetical protein